MAAKRAKTKKIFVGSVPIGGGSPIAVQSMTKTDTRDIKATLRQIRALKRAGCEIVRLAVPDMEAAEALGGIIRSCPLPVIADIHFDWRLALKAVSQGASGLRINPGNIGAKWKLAEVVTSLKDKGIPLRVGVNAGSLEKDLLRKYGHPSAQALIESAERHISMLEDMGFYNIKVSLKASNVPSTVEACRIFSKRHRHPLHVGVSEAGPLFSGLIKSSVGLGILLSEGIGDTVRVSLTANPVKEVRAAYQILRSLNLRERGVEIISCPTCGRCGINLIGLVAKVEKRLMHEKKPMTVAVMGCAVNGPGEAREADIGIAAAKGMGLLFKGGKVIKKVKEKDLLDELIREAERL
ncbi:MAG: flavodoxin-dependent (E)-4-hydroxy-3-methylbut-2-enyl-diphosphate synthase [Thermodesulfovibrionales bacterium]|nr:flavodoxin-dependent (E)-4-hydroxy-3-methylbut-2-enyl-diphosphate synthase [Thermodesulfovibrionales bacterium]